MNKIGGKITSTTSSVKEGEKFLKGKSNPKQNYVE